MSDAMRARQFQPGFRDDLHHTRTSAAREVGVTMPLGVVVTQLMGALRKATDPLDHSALLLLVEQLSGRAHPVLSVIRGPGRSA